MARGSNPAPTRYAPLAARILAAGSAAAAADALWGIGHFVLYRDLITAGRFFQSIARGLLGPAAFEGGASTAALGAALHLLIGCIWAALYRLALDRSPRLRARVATRGGALAAGLVLGAVIWLGMDLVVLPLSAAPAVPVRSTAFLLQLAAHARAGFTFPPPWIDEAQFLWQAKAFAETGTLLAPQLHPERAIRWMPRPRTCSGRTTTPRGSTRTGSGARASACRAIPTIR